MLDRACQPVIELLEDRKLFSSTTVQTLPFALDFSSDRGELVDKDGQGTGFTRVQANKNGTEYQPALIDLDTAAGVLKITTTGSSSTGSNYNSDNTLTNALETQFDATTSGFKITARLIGPLSYIDIPSEQAGISFGPDQDNYIKLVAIAQSTNGVNTQYLQFADEQTTGSTSTHTLSQLTSIGSFASLTSLDLQLVGDASTGQVTAYYATNGGAFIKLPNSVTLSGTKYNAFFNATGRAGLIQLHKNNSGPITATYDSFKIEAGSSVALTPKVTGSRPGNAESNVPRNAFVAADVFLPTSGAGIDASTMDSTTVMLYRTSDHSPVQAVLNTSGGGDAIVLTPTSLLDPNTNYTFEVTSGLKDLNGAAFAPYSATFTTGTGGGAVDSSLAFEKVALPTTQGNTYTCVTMGPDGKLYASTVDGVIQRFTINPDGTLSAPFNITSLQTKEGGPRIIIGIAFDAAGNLWVSHNEFTDLNSAAAADWTGKISKLSGVNYATAATAVIGLPRSVRDHMTNQIVFGPDGALYFAQGANTAMGAPDNTWGNRAEHLLNSAVLRLDITKLGASPLNVQTDSGGTYNPFDANNALTIYATGVRNAYDLVWTSNGKLFAPTNGSAAGGNTPGTPASPYSYGPQARIDFPTKGAYTGPNVPAITNGPTQNDYVFNIVKGGYYGQPNPSRGEFVLNGGNPTSGVDTGEVTTYPVGTQPDRNYRGLITGSAAATQGSAYIFGKNYSPDGVIEYQGSAFGGSLNGKLLVCEYSGGDEVVVLTPDVNGNIIARQSGIAGLTHFTDPVDLTEDKNTGFLYIVEFGGQKITLARPITPGANATTDKSQMVFTDQTSAGASAAQKITITNTGTSPLAFPSDGFTITGTDSSKFAITQKPTLPTSIAPGDSVDVWITFTAGASDTDVYRTATLQIKSNDPNQPTFTIPLRGLGTSGTGGANEPSLQQLMNLFQYPINVGDTTPNETNLNDPPAQPNDEIVMPTLVKAGTGPVTIESLAAFGVGNATIPTFRFGYYTPGNRTDLTELLKNVGVANGQTVMPVMSGVSSFDPGSAAFGLYTYWQNFTSTGSPTVYSEDQLNKTYDSHSPRKLRFYPLKDSSGATIPNAYIFAWEEFNNGYDNQDYVGIIRNVQAAPGIAGPEFGIENLDGTPFSDRLIFNKVQNSNNSSTGKPNNIFHDKSTIRLRNTGASTLTISSLVASANFTIVSPPTFPFTIAPGATKDITIQFTANPGGSTSQSFTGTLTITSNDADESTAVIQLAGHWQPVNEANKEPLLQPIVDLLGYKTKILNAGQVLNQQGKVARVGDEVLSAYWHRADSTLPVGVRQIAGYHTQGNVATTAWHNKGSNTTTTLFVMDGEEAQSLLPHKNVAATGSIGTDFAAGSFSPAGSFGFKIDSEWSDPTKNIQDKPGGGYGHHVRFWVIRDRDGNIVPNTYLMSMDYSGINYDYQDNVYLVTNIQPDSGPSTPTGLGAVGNGISLNWADNTEANLAGYNVYRATSSGGTYTKINSTLVTSSDYIDSATSIGSTYFYKVTAVDNAGNESAQTASVSTTRTSDANAPASPKNLVSSGTVGGIHLDWANNTEQDLAGYNVYRSSSAGGPFTKLTGVLLTTSDYIDTTAPVGVISYYQVTAVDSSNNESAPSSTNTTRPSNDQTPPAAPSTPTATPSQAGIALDWTNNAEVDLAGYNVYRSADGVSGWTKLNVSLLLSSDYNDTTAPANAKSYYRITAVDTSSNESQPATTNATRPPADQTPPAAPSGLGAVDSANGVVLDWTDNSDGDLAGYNVYRATSPAGPFTKINTSLIVSSNYLDTTAANGTSYYRVTAVDSSNNESDFASTSAAHVVPFTFNEIGNPLPAGSFTTVTSNKDYNVTAGGADIYGTADSFGFLDQQVTGDFDFAVRLNSLTNPNALAKAGLMARESLAANSRNTFLYATPTASGTYRMTTRGSTGGSTSAAGTGPSSYPNTWLRLQRVGNTFNGYRSTNGVDWTLVNSVTLNVGSTIFFGMAAVSHTTTATTTAQFRDLTNLAAPPDTKPNAPTGATATGSESGILVDWANNGEADIKGYNVYRSDAADGVYALLNSGGPIVSSDYFDATAPENATSYYKITAIDLANQESDLSAVASALRPTDVPPATPDNFQGVSSSSGNLLTWDFPANGTDLAGYNVYRSDAADGLFTKLNSQLISAAYFNDATAPNGTSYYQLYAVDQAGHESIAPATLSLTRDLPPAQPQNFVADPQSDGIHLSWNANGESDLAGYQLYRSTDGVQWTPLGGVMPFVAFNDTFAQPGVPTQYRLAAVDNANQESTYATLTSTRPQSLPTVKINFQLNGSPTVAGYDQDNGDTFGLRSNGMTYGFNKTHVNDDRDRNKNGDQLLDTLVQMQTNSNWSINIANGTYTVKISIGDSQYTSNNTLNVNGTNYWTGQALGVNQFATQTQTIVVTNGKIVLDNAGSPDRMTKLNYIEITPA